MLSRLILWFYEYIHGRQFWSPIGLGHPSICFRFLFFICTLHPPQRNVEDTYFVCIRGSDKPILRDQASTTGGLPTRAGVATCASELVDLQLAAFAHSTRTSTADFACLEVTTVAKAASVLSRRTTPAAIAACTATRQMIVRTTRRGGDILRLHWHRCFSSRPSHHHVQPERPDPLQHPTPSSHQGSHGRAISTPSTSTCRRDSSTSTMPHQTRIPPSPRRSQRAIRRGV
jgi:hypothetical protein